MAHYRVTFKPSGAYFFGNEKTFAFTDGKNDYGKLYYIRSEIMPAQSTILGALRYMLLAEKGFDRVGSAANVEAVGERSFDIDATGQTFGSIRSVSPVTLLYKGQHFVHAPLDHKVAKECKQYTPFCQYLPMSIGDHETRLYADDYDVKRGLTSAFMSVSDGTLKDDFFKTDVRVGINRRNQDSGFFKKESVTLKSGAAFCVYAEIEGAQVPCSEAVYLGQGKVPFAVSFEQVDGNAWKNDVAAPLRALLEKTHASITALTGGMIYCMSDMLADDDKVSDGLYKGMLFAVTNTHDYRTYKTLTGGGVEKGAVLHKLVRAGSVFFPVEPMKEEWALNTDMQKNARTIGLNTVVITGGK